MYFYELIEKYGKGANNDKMKKLTMVLSDYFDDFKHAHEDKYWMLMRKVMGVLNDGHYDDKFAMHDVADIEYTDRQGVKRKGAYWTLEQVKEATKDYKFPNGVNDWDVYVAANAIRADLCKNFDDKQVLDAMYAFFFADEDWKNGASKIWDYFCCKYAKNGI